MSNNGSIGSKRNKLQVQENWKETIWKKENDSKNDTKYIKKKFRKTSKFRVVTKTLVEDIIEYLFLVTQPTKKIKKEKNMEKTPVKSKLYSISQIDKLGSHNKFTQNK